MQHLRVLLWGLFVSCYCGSSDSFFVSQFPSTLVLRKGEQVQIICSWNISIARAKVKWIKDCRAITFKQNGTLVHTEPSKSNSTLVIKNAYENDAGFYTCEVTQDVPQLLKANGSGTNITYETQNEPVTIIRPVSSTSPSTTEQPVTTTTTTTKPASTTSPNTEWAVEEVYEDGPIIFTIRCVPFVTLLLAVWFLNRGEKNKRSRAGPQTTEKQDLYLEENEQKGQDKLEQERKEEERDKQRGQEKRVKTEDELTVEVREVKERAKQKGQRRVVEVVIELTGQERDLIEGREELNECVG